MRIEQPGRSSPGAAGPDEEPSTADLVKGIADDASTLVKQEILLARQELTEGLTKAAKASALLVAAGLVGLYALGLLFETLAWSLEALGLPPSSAWSASGAWPRPRSRPSGPRPSCAGPPPTSRPRPRWPRPRSRPT